MTTESVKRKLTAILSADVKGYSRLMGEDEVATVHTITAYREVMATLIQKHRGRVVDSPGDNLLAEFGSVVDGVQCAVEIQTELKARNVDLPENRRMKFRIGINLGDVIEEGERIYGDGINIAARIEGLAEGGGICISGTTYDQVKNKLDLGYEFLGKKTVKNIKEPVRVYRILMDLEAVGSIVYRRRKDGPIHKRRATIIALLILIVGVGAFTIWNFFLRTAPPSIEPASIEKMAFPLPDKPSIAVLPFDNMSGDPGQEYIADGITENIITALSNSSGMFVIARNSTFIYKGKPVKVQQVSEDLGVRYVLEGSVQKSGDRIRVTAQLIDATTGHHLRSERYDRDIKDLFAVQDDITKEIVVALQVELTDGEQARVWHRTTDNFEAWGYVAKGGCLFERYMKGDNIRARKLFEQALEIDPKYAFAWTMLAWTHLIDAWLGFSESHTESIKQAVELAKKAGALDDTLPEVRSLWSTIYLIQGQYKRAVLEGEKAIALGPNNALTHILLAKIMLFGGKFEKAIALAEKSIRLTPYCPDWFLSILAQSYRQAGRYEEALAAFTKSLERSRKNKSNSLLPTVGLTDVYMQLGREEEARAYAAEVLKIDPTFSLEGYRRIYSFKDPAHLEPILINLRKAGLK